MTVVDMSTLSTPARMLGAKIAELVGFGISPIGDLIVCRAVDVAEDGPREPPPRHRAKIAEVVALIDTHAIT
jgi:hypothetical protein